MHINKEFYNIWLMQKGLSVKCDWDLKILRNFWDSLTNVEIITITNCMQMQSYQKRRNYNCKHILYRIAFRRDNIAPWQSNHVCKTYAFQDPKLLSVRCWKTQMTKSRTLVGLPWFRLCMTNPSPDNWVAITHHSMMWF